jgi:hypothetical protein
MTAATHGHVNIVQFFLKNEANPWISDADGNALTHAAKGMNKFTGNQRGNQFECAQVLLNKMLADEREWEDGGRNQFFAQINETMKLANLARET